MRLPVTQQPESHTLFFFSVASRRVGEGRWGLCGSSLHHYCGTGRALFFLPLGRCRLLFFFPACRVPSKALIDALRPRARPKFADSRKTRWAWSGGGAGIESGVWHVWCRTEQIVVFVRIRPARGKEEVQAQAG